LSRQETHHLRDVLRLKSGSVCTVIDAGGREWRAKVTEFSRDRLARLELDARLEMSCSSPFRLWIGQGIPKRVRMDWIVAKAAELGVYRLIPIASERSVLSGAEAFARVAKRWERIVQEARKQSGSAVKTEVSAPCLLKSFLGEAEKIDLRYFFQPSRGRLFSEMLAALREKKNAPAGLADVAVLIGPEGGFSERECQEAAARGMKSVRLNGSVLKSDTAFVAIASAILFGI